MNKNKLFAYALLCLSLTAYNCKASGSESKEVTTQALMSVKNPLPQSEQQLSILLSLQLGTSEIIIPENTATETFNTIALPDSIEQLLEKECGDSLESWMNIDITREPIQFQQPQIATVIEKYSYTGKKHHECTICNKSFVNLSDLERHMRIHTGEKPFLCEICGTSFIQSSNLERHMRIHTGEKPFLCEICGRSFTNSSNLVTHRRTHTGEKPYECEVCDKAFTQLGSLTRHERIHTDEKPYKCTTCEKLFASLSNCKRHALVHVSENTFEDNMSKK